tara:strand:+ start:3795 stop:4895 length:1101 start_codon:yes stop_codon:yes gene_type:complete
MENTNITNNLIIKQLNQSDAIAYNLDYLASPTNNDFNLLNKAYEFTGKIYAKMKLSIQNGTCVSENCELEIKKLLELEAAPQKSLDFLSDLISQVSVVDEPNYDPNNNFVFTVIHSLLSSKPGFSKTDGYNISMHLLHDGSQQLVFSGPGIPGEFTLNNTALTSLLESGTSLVVSTPDIGKNMMELLKDVKIFSEDMVNEDGDLLPTAKISEEFVLVDAEGNPIYEVVDLGDNKGRNVLQYDMDKIDKKTSPFINAEVAGLLSSEQSAVAAWNVYIAQGTSQEEDDQMVQDANAGHSSWSYEKDLPLSQSNKVLFEKKYKEYFMKNYLKQFTTNQLPSVQADAAVFDLEQSKKQEAQKFLADNNLN